MTTSSSLVARFLVVEPFAENSWIIGCRSTGEAVLVDPGGRVPELLQIAAEEDLDVGAIWLTHAHLDHVTGVAAAVAELGDVPILLHPEDRPLYEATEQQGMMFGLDVDQPPAPTDWLEAPGSLRLGALEVEVLPLPGHSPGHVGFWIPAARTVVSGDVLFAGSIGRTDLPGGDLATLMRSIHDRLLPLGDDVRVLSGHGPDTTIARERASNPFLTGAF
jgi:glyoxylase-like metal-dependent hydrolase (beta-lactamase superfamily II)